MIVSEHVATISSFDKLLNIYRAKDRRRRPRKGNSLAHVRRDKARWRLPRFQRSRSTT